MPGDDDAATWCEIPEPAPAEAPGLLAAKGTRPGGLKEAPGGERARGGGW